MDVGASSLDSADWHMGFTTFKDDRLFTVTMRGIKPRKVKVD